MADIEIMELRAFEPRCLDCGETGPIETSWFYAMAWEEQHVCVAARLDGDTGSSDDLAARDAESDATRSVELSRAS